MGEMELRLVFTRENMNLHVIYWQKQWKLGRVHLKRKEGLQKCAPPHPAYISPPPLLLAFFLHIPACKVFISSCIVFSQGEKGDQGKECEGGDIKVCKRVHNAYIIASRS